MGGANGWPRRLATPGAARAVHLATALIAGGSLILQLVIVAKGGAHPLPTRLVRFFGYFTVQSNILVCASTALLAADPRRDGRVFRVLRLAGLIGITVTGIVYVTVLYGTLELSAGSRVADVGLHQVTPVLAVAGWALLGPRRRTSRAVASAMLAWPLIWFAWTLAHGAVAGFSPYDFINVDDLGYGRALLNAGIVMVLLVGLLAGALALDRRLARWGPWLEAPARR